MREQTLSQFPQDEQDAFRDTCLRNGISPDGFTVTAVEGEPAQPPAQAQAKRAISVRFGGGARQYDGDQGVQWTVDFEDDLVSRVFG